MNSGGSEVLAPRVVLDTSAYSRLRSGNSRVHDLIAAAEVVLIPATVIGELHGAFELGSRGRENRVTLDEFLAEPFVVTVPITADVARQYGRVFAALRRGGTPIPVNDIWIAAAAIDRGGCLLTFDAAFRHVAHLDHILLQGVEPGTED